METAASEVRAEPRGIMARIHDIDDEPLGPVTFCEEWESQCMIDYCQDCRACPDAQMPTYEEYKLDWLDCRLHDEAMAADVEAIEERLAEAAMVRQGPAPLTSPCGDDESDYPW